MSRLAHSNQETMDKIEADALAREESGIRDEPPECQPIGCQQSRERQLITIRCEVCGGEGRDLRANGNDPDPIDYGVCKACNGDCVVEVEAFPITLADLYAIEEAMGLAAQFMDAVKPDAEHEGWWTEHDSNVRYMLTEGLCTVFAIKGERELADAIRAATAKQRGGTMTEQTLAETAPGGVNQLSGA